MKLKILNFILILTSLAGYLEWGKGNNIFLFQAEADIVSKLFTNPTSVLHPFTVLPLAGQILLLITLFQSKPNKIHTYTGIAGIGILLALMLIVGSLSLNFKMILSTLPFFVIAFYTVRYLRRTKTG